MEIKTVLVIGDTHFRSKFYNQGLELIKKCTRIAQRKKPDIIVALGDILHTHADTRQAEYELAEKFIRGLSSVSRLYIIMGNHDYINNSQYLTDKHFFNPFKKWPNVTIVDTVIRDQDLVFCPYVQNDKFFQALDNVEWKNAKCIFSHIEIRGAVMRDQGSKWSKKYPLLVSGHIHKKQWLGKNVYYPGSSSQVNCDEDPEKIIALINIENGHVKEIPLKISGIRLIKTSISGLDDVKIQDEIHQVKIKLECTDDQFQTLQSSKKYKKLKKVVQFDIDRIETEQPIDIKTDTHTFQDILLELISKTDYHTQEIFNSLDI